VLDILGAFARRGGQRRVAEYLLKHGIRISPDSLLWAGEAEVSQVSIARILEVDRRVVKAAITAVVGSPKLMAVYSNLAVTPSLRNLAAVLGYGAIEIVPRDAKDKGIVAAVAAIISSSGIGIRQVIADDPMFDNPELTVVTEKPIPRGLIDRMLRVKGVQKVVVLN